jgi:sugar O-acyltransferase (sialic acid O-acetyltransferase NeuD family)
MRVFFFGGRDQARLNYSILRKQGHTVPFVFDSDPMIAPGWDCVTFNNPEKIEAYARQCDGFLVCIGNETRGRLRVEMSLRFLEMGLEAVSAVHPDTFFGDDVICGKGLQTYPRSSVHDRTVIGDYCLIGLNAAIDHDCLIGAGVTIMNSAAVIGNCTIEDYAVIGINATILPHVTVSKGSVIEAGAVVRRPDVVPTDGAN